MAAELFEEKRDPLNLLHLPEEILENIVSFLTYHETSETRLVRNNDFGGWGRIINK